MSDCRSVTPQSDAGTGLTVRHVRPEEYERSGRVVVAAYTALAGDHLSHGYEEELMAVERRAVEAEVLVAVQDLPPTGTAGAGAAGSQPGPAEIATRPAGSQPGPAEIATRPAGSQPGPGGTQPGASVLGCVTFVPDSTSPWAELLERGESGIRMLGVDPAAQGRGIGGALVDACVARATELGSVALVLHSTPWMETAQRIYVRVGFERFPERDWTPVPDVPLLAFRLLLTRPGRTRP